MGCSSLSEVQVVELKWVNDKSREHIGRNRAAMEEQHRPRAPDDRPEEFDLREGYTNSEKQNDDVKKRMEDERAATEAQRGVDLLAWHKTLNDRLESFSQNYPPRTVESDHGPS
ncbi:hypothetical protein Tco_0717566 [Tanacetum coccineum]